MLGAYPQILPSSGELDKAVIKSAGRVLQIFEYFADRRCPSSATEIATALDFPQSSASMLLRSLVSLGYLDFHREVRTFEPTIRLSLLGGWIPERIDVAGRIIDLLNKLHDDTGETVVLSELHQTYVRYIYVLQRPSSSFSYYIRPGTLRRVCTTATGRMLLTLLGEQDVLAIVHRANAEADNPVWIKRSEFLAELEVCRAQGFSELVMPDRIGMQAAVLLPADGSGRRLAVGVISEDRPLTEQADAIRERLLKIADHGGAQPVA